MLLSYVATKNVRHADAELIRIKPVDLILHLLERFECAVRAATEAVAAVCVALAINQTINPMIARAKTSRRKSAMAVSANNRPVAQYREILLPPERDMNKIDIVTHRMD